MSNMSYSIETKHEIGTHVCQWEKIYQYQILNEGTTTPIPQTIREQLPVTVRYRCVICGAIKEEIQYANKNQAANLETQLENALAENRKLLAELRKYKAFWEQARLTDRMKFEQYDYKPEDEK